MCIWMYNVIKDTDHAHVCCVFTVPTDKDGILVDELGKLLEEHYPIDKNINQKSPFWAMVYLIPVFSNPKGYTLPPGKT